MSTIDVWTDEAELDWGPRPAGALGPEPARRRPGRPWRRATALVALVVVVTGSLVFAYLDGGAPSAASPPPLRAPADAPAEPAPAVTALDAIAHCESRGDPTAVSADGIYRGKYQFDLATWQSVGGVGDPALAPEREQDRRAQMLAADRGTAPWPNCATAGSG